MTTPAPGNSAASIWTELLEWYGVAQCGRHAPRAVRSRKNIRSLLELPQSQGKQTEIGSDSLSLQSIRYGRGQVCHAFALQSQFGGTREVDGTAKRAYSIG